MSAPIELKICPYNKSHVVQGIRYHSHISKCRRNHKGSLNFVQCPFNATHEVPAIELPHHKMHCPDKDNILSDMQYAITKQLENEQGDQLSITNRNRIDTSNRDFSWENDLNDVKPMIGYDPELVPRPDNHMHSLTELNGMSRKQRNDYYQRLLEEHHNRMATDGLNDGSVSSSNDSCKSPVKSIRFDVSMTTMAVPQTLPVAKLPSQPPQGVGRGMPLSTLTGLKKRPRIAASIFGDTGSVVENNSHENIPPLLPSVDQATKQLEIFRSVASTRGVGRGTNI